MAGVHHRSFFRGSDIRATHRTERNLNEVAEQLRPADLLLFRGSGFVSRFISMAGRSEYSHAAKVDRWGEDLFCCEVREWKGGRIVTLASQILKYPGRIDVFNSNPENIAGYNREASATYMRRFAGQDYGWQSVLLTSFQYLPVFRFILRHNYQRENGRENGRTPYCSQACSAADHHGGGIDPVSLLADRFTLPGDLAHSPFYRYFCTLTGV